MPYHYQYYKNMKTQQEAQQEIEMQKIIDQDNFNSPKQADLSVSNPQEATNFLKRPYGVPQSLNRLKNGIVATNAKPQNSSTIKLDDFRAKSLLSYGLNKFQVETIYSQTPKGFIKSRKGRGGRNFEYIPVYVVIKYLNIIFGCGWDFEIIKDEIMWDHKQVLVKGRLTLHLINGNKIIKEQYASKEIQYYKDRPSDVISIGDDLKGAGSLCLTKCASYLGLFSDIYSNEYYLQYELPDEIRENGEINKDKLFVDTKNLISKVPKESKNQAIENAIKSGQFTESQAVELETLKILDPIKDAIKK